MAKSWYILQVQANHERKCCNLIERTLQPTYSDSILSAKVPEEDFVEIASGQRRTVKKKFLPGYVLIELSIPKDDAEWRQLSSSIRRIPGVLGFPGVDMQQRPRPLSNLEAKQLLQRMGELKGPDKALSPAMAFQVGDVVKIIEGVFADFEGRVEEVGKDKSRLKVHVEIFGRKTLVDVGFSEVKRI